MKRWLAMVAAVTAAVLLLALCIPLLRSDDPVGTTAATTPGTNGSRPTGTEPATDPEETQEPNPYEVLIHQIPEQVDNPDGLPVLSWVVLGDSPIYDFREGPVVEANRMLADNNMPFRLQITFLNNIAQPVLSSERIPIDYFTRPETKEILENADIISGDFKDGEMEKYLIPITEYVSGDAQPSLANAVPSPLDWSWSTAGEEIYGVPTLFHQVQSVGWQIDGAFWSQYGLTAEDFSRPYWEMDDLFAEIYAQNGGKPFLHIPSGYSSLCSTVPVHYQTVEYTIGYRPYSTVFAIDTSAEKPTVVNLLETDTVYKIWQAMIRYQKAGYAISGQNITLPLRFGMTIGTEMYGRDNDICIPVGESVCRQYVVANHPAVGVGAGSQHKELAISLLKHITDNKAFRMQLAFGTEGKDYTFADGELSVVTNEKGWRYRLSVSLLEDFDMEFGSDMLRSKHEGKTLLQSYLDNLDGVTLKDCPIIFDYTGFEKVLTSLKSVWRTTYFTCFTQHEATDKGPAMTEQRYAEMLQQLRDIGCEELRQELQRQLDEWLAANPDWSAQYG